MSLEVCGILGGPLFKNPQPTVEHDVDQGFNPGPLAMTPSLCFGQAAFSTSQFNAALVSLCIFTNVLWFSTKATKSLFPFQGWFFFLRDLKEPHFKL